MSWGWFWVALSFVGAGVGWSVWLVAVVGGVLAAQASCSMIIILVTLIIGAFASGEFVLQQLQTRWPREAEAIVAEAVSYTHLTLPTNREV